MILPNKAVPFNKSILSKLPRFLEQINKPTRVAALYRESSQIFNSVEEFIYAVDLLKILGKIDFMNGDIVNVNRVEL